MTIITVQAFRNGEPMGEYTAKSDKMNEQQMVDYIFEHGKEEIGFKFLTSYGFIDPSITRRMSQVVL